MEQHLLHHMRLHFLDFDYSEDEEGTATWDAIATVAARRMPELEAEIIDVLTWSHTEFGVPSDPLESGGLWNYDLQCERDNHPLLALMYDPVVHRLTPLPPLLPDEHVTLTLSLCGGRAFGEAFAARFS
jgi:hypothetical protein